MSRLSLFLRAQFAGHRNALLSAAIHLSIAFLLLGGLARSPKVAPYRLPGTALGVTTLTYYSPGNQKPVKSETELKSREKTAVVPKARPVPDAVNMERTQVAASEAGVGEVSKSGIGEGDITIALQTVFLYPKPDLSTLPRGTKGNVILDAVIDEHGKISKLTLLKGLGSPVDETVIAAVRQWEYTPAKKNGVPVASEQELHFYYERG